jgi:hypothetical protein
MHWIGNWVDPTVDVTAHARNQTAAVQPVASHNLKHLNIAARLIIGKLESVVMHMFRRHAYFSAH